MKHTSIANLYNPHEQSQEQLIQRFVVRHDIFGELYEAIKAFEMTQPGPHYLIEGQRGAGKTSLLLRLSYEIENDPDLQYWLIPIVFKEEAYYGIRRLFNLWEAVMYELAGKDHAFEGLFEHVQATYDRLKNYERVCFEAVIEALEKNGGDVPAGMPAIPGKRVILCIDNLGEMLRNFSDEENQRLRDILKQAPYFRLIGASTVVLEALFHPEHPFHGFFQKKRLEGLNKEDTYRLLRQLAKVYDKEETIKRVIEQQPGRAESLRILTGGVIRTIILLFEIFAEQEESHTLADLDTVLDRVTPLYKHRMDDLTPLHREVVHTIALHWDALSAEEIARKTRLNVTDVETVVNELENVFIIERTGVETQQPFYRLKERFFNIWYLMRLSSGGSRAKVVWLVHFLESWYNEKELNQHARNHIQALTTGQYQPQSAYYLTEAFARTGKLDQETEHQMLLTTKKLLQETAIHLATELSSSDKEMFKEGEAYYQSKRYEQAITSFLNMKNKHSSILFRLGYAFSQLTHYQEAALYLSQAAEREHVDAMLHLGFLYQHHLHDNQSAEKYYLLAAEKKQTDAILKLGTLYHHVFRDYQKAEYYYLMVIKEAKIRSKVLTAGGFSLKGLRNYLVTAIKGDVDDPEQYQFDDLPGARRDYLETIQTISSEALFQLGSLYANELKHTQKAAMYYQKAADAGHIKAIMNLGDFYNYRLKDHARAEKYYLMAAEQNNLTAMVTLGLLYHEELKDYEQAEKFYTMAAEQGDLTAMNALAWLYFEHQREKEKALRCIRNTIKVENNIYTAHTAACVYLWNDHTEEAFRLAEQFMYSKEAHKTLEDDIVVYLLLLLAKECYQQFTVYCASPDLDVRERFKPLYYAYLHFSDDPNYQKLPPELSEPVEDIVRKVEQMKKIMQ